MAFTITADLLTSLPTKLLLHALRMSCIDDATVDRINSSHDAAGIERNDDYSSKARVYETHHVPARAFGFDDNVDCRVTIAELKFELSKRPHVPNKQEGQALRRAKNLRGRQKGRGDR